MSVFVGLKRWYATVDISGSPLPGIVIHHFSYAVQAFLGFQKYKLGADSALFSQEYVDPTADPNAASPMGTDYTSYAADIDTAASTEPAFDGSAGYQGQEY
ncbi:unnamed protein product [Oncorhynchus mykiss]|uniref:Uncharacterized protein n=1 Tax=Oncorhynchus mykiss TaxID=8022 RepID=A0A060X1G6_ONCMY|nr:unnamed protein product [Oncorhynchus mykiss]